MINRFALSCLCIELDRDEMYGVTLVYILMLDHIPYLTQVKFMIECSYYAQRWPERYYHNQVKWQQTNLP